MPGPMQAQNPTNAQVAPTVSQTPYGPVMPHGNVAGVPHPATLQQKVGPQNIAVNQAVLAKLGYKVTVDGVAGPQYKSATAAKAAGISPNAWNAAQGGNVAAPAATPQGKVAGVAPKGAPAGTVSTPAAVPPATTTGSIQGSDPSLLQQVIAKINAEAPASDASQIQAAGAGLQNNQINAQGTATAAANAQYNPVISGLQSQVDQSKTQATTNQGDITGWYGTLVQNMKDRADAENVAGDKELTAISSTAPQTSSALGFAPGTAGANAIDAPGDIQANGARMANQANSDFNDQLGAVTQAQGLASAVNQGNIDSNKTTDLQNQVAAQQSARGQDITALTAQNRQQNQTNNNAYVTAKEGIIAATQGAKQQAYANKQAGVSSLIAGTAAQSTANLQNAEAGKYTAEGTAAGTNAAAASTRAQAAMISANAAKLRASNGTMTAEAAQTRARASFKTAMSKANAQANDVFAGVTGVNTQKVGSSILTAITGSAGYKNIQNNPQALAQAVNQQVQLAGGDLSKTQSKVYAITLMNALGQSLTPAQQKAWFNYGAGAPKVVKVKSPNNVA